MSSNVKDEQELFEITIKPIEKRFYSETNNYGIYKVKLEHDSDNIDLVQCDEFDRNLMLVGNMPDLKYGEVYVAQVEEIEHPKFGIQYKAKVIFEKPFSSRADQIIFLRTILTDKQVNTIIEAYPDEDLIQLFKEDGIEAKYLNGIGDITLNKIKAKILYNEKYQKVIIELCGKYSIPYNAVVTLSQKYGSPELLLDKINENPYILTELDGFGFKRVDELALSMGVEKDSPHRIESCLKYIIVEQAENNGHVWIKSSKAISEAIKLLGLKLSNIQHMLDIIVEDKTNDIFRVEEKLFIMRNFEYEYGIFEHIQRLLAVEPVVSFDFDFNKAVEEVEEEQGFEFTDEQKQAIKFGIEKNVLVVTGKAGVGKTAVIKGIVKVLQKHQAKLDEEANKNKETEVEKGKQEQVDDLGLETGSIKEMNEGLTYATCALSGKASQRIQESTGLDSFTIHRLLAFNPNLGWVYDENNKLAKDVIVLDEGSMVNSQLFYYLVRAIESGAKFIITGDTAQLEPIGVGNILVDLLKIEAVPSVELTIVHRQAQKSGILSNANLVRDGLQFYNPREMGMKNNRMGELKDLYMYPSKTKEKVFDSVIQIAKKYNGDILDFQILTPMKSKGDLSTQNLNNELQKIFNQDPEDIDATQKIVRKHSTLLIGDKVIINSNDYEKNVFNGTMGIIEYISTEEKGEIIIDFENIGLVKFVKDEMIKIDLAYAITIHKSQGSQWKYVVLAFDYSSYILLNRQLVYTGMTRASLALFFPVEIKALQYAIDTDRSSNRNTLVSEFFEENELLLKFATKC